MNRMTPEQWLESAYEDSDFTTRHGWIQAIEILDQEIE